MSITSSKKVADFGANLKGDLICPGDPRYDSARRVWNGMIDKYPREIVRCVCESDVINAVNHARINDLVVAVRGGGHNVAGTGTCDDGIVIDLSSMKAVRVDPSSLRIQCQAGLTCGEFDAATQAFGLGTTSGMISTTGIAGLTTGGGVGWLMGKYGLTCDNLLSVDVVLADGRFVRANDNENVDLFWALRGGSGNFGIVTSFEYRLHQVGPVLAGAVYYPLARSKDVLRFYRELSNQAPDELTIYLFRLLLSDGTPSIAVAVCYCGKIEEGERLLQRLETLGPPLADRVRPMSYCELQQLYDSTSPAGENYYWKGSFLRELNDDAIDAAAEYFLTAPSPQCRVFIEHLHGAVNRIPLNQTAFSHREANYNFVAVARWKGASGDGASEIRWARNFHRALQPITTGGVYVNALGVEGSDRIRAAYGANYARLSCIKDKYDPTNFFRINQNLKPSGV